AKAVAAHGGVTYAAIGLGGVVKSTDDGNTWAPYGLKGADVQQILLPSEDPDLVLASTESLGVFRSTDGGTTCDGMALGLCMLCWRGWPCGMQVTALTADSKAIYAAIDRTGIFRSTDLGASWTATGFQAAYGLPYEVNAIAATGPVIYAGVRRSIVTN